MKRAEREVNDLGKKRRGRQQWEEEEEGDGKEKDTARKIGNRSGEKERGRHEAEME